MAKRWVIKLGSGLLTRKDGKVDRVQIGRIVDQVAGLHKRGVQVVLVTSGAVAAGMTAMGLEKRPKEARELQACATVGQPVFNYLFRLFSFLFTFYLVYSFYSS